VIVAVLDTGVDYTHPDLVNQMWRNPGEIPGNGVDDDGNGFIDDIYGIDTCHDDTDPMDDHSHGTHCAGTIAAEAGNHYGIAGATVSNGWNKFAISCDYSSKGWKLRLPRRTGHR